MDPNSKQKKQHRRASILESLKEIGDQTAKSFSGDLVKESSKDFMRQLFGQQMPANRQFSGEILPQETVTIDEVLSGEREEKQKIEKQLMLERQLRAEEQALVEKKTRELQLTIHALMQELSAVVVATPKLATELQIAAIQAPVSPGIYHVIFFEKLIEYIRGFRHKIEDAAIWLHAANKRAAKKTFWSQYKTSGGRRLLSAEDYSGRSAA